MTRDPGLGVASAKGTDRPRRSPRVDDDFPDADPPPLPAVVAWEALSAGEYAATLATLDDWVRWLVRLYRVEYQTIPDCWYRHPEVLEDLGHLWTGWLMTRHPQAGVGAIGLDWDRNREATLARCRSATDKTGCRPTTGHQTSVERSWPANYADSLHDHVEHVRADRDSAGIAAATEQAALAALMAAERRGPKAQQLASRMTDPAAPTEAELSAAVDALASQTQTAPDRAAQVATEAAKTRRATTDIERAEERLTQARIELAQAVARGSTERGDLVERWVAALDALAPAMDAVIAAARMAAAARSSAAAINARHPNLAGLLDGVDGDDADPGE